jgi:hypothetical protein
VRLQLQLPVALEEAFKDLSLPPRIREYFSGEKALPP